MKRRFLIIGLGVLCLMPILGAYVEKTMPEGAVLKAVRLQADKPEPRHWVY
ncbi:hypothetical protein [Pseudooceanicola algae]|uniref:Uncharacterized protein n=1 Tax=Pseudooceanicola algae TaxID=1537215 RepID=A0A418SJE1_9RHOB|nr:hypothetical protein [Pseudooceanicola algae]QPM91864.1 hypothetical protein PSAL_031260 [Pseudooceanicola algae]